MQIRCAVAVAPGGSDCTVVIARREARQSICYRQNFEIRSWPAAGATASREAWTGGRARAGKTKKPRVQSLSGLHVTEHYGRSPG